MLLKKLGLLIIVAGMATATGCATYRTSSDSSPARPSTVNAAPSARSVMREEVRVYEGDLPGGKYEKVGYIQVSVKKLTLFHKDPTKEQANAALIGKARGMGADAVIHATYKSGIGLTTWGYINATGTAVRFVD